MYWAETPSGPCDDVEVEEEWFRGAMAAICDAAMPRIRAPPRRPVYWWSDEIAAMRASSVVARRRFTRFRRRRSRDLAREEELYRDYRQATVALQSAIKDGKARAWNELLDFLDRDPWGRPYRIVIGRLRPPAPPVTESLDPDVLERVVDTLFLDDPEERGSAEQADPITWPANVGVSEQELADAVAKLGTRNTAPGPDGIPGRAWVMALRVLGPRFRRLLDGCLKSGRVP
ncbi:uncharacterized protein LOC128888315 [Hylaeus anthracinus]|uniref:uncharacterized protein LOC128888315 n=1 Tax=Hylaeus anthracinus TaxID=313031 RepID=UPI0023B93CBC|nr:uncharacterized protein LOC128888315 [Hylaeus anthracinus]